MTTEYFASGSQILSAQRTNNLEPALYLASLGLPIVPEHTPDPSTPTGCDCHHADCTKPGKHPRTKNGDRDATTDLDQITSWWSRIWPHANIGTSVGKAGLVIIAPDCPERDAEFQALGLEGAVVVQSGGGEGHKQYWYRRSADFPQTRVCKADDYDIISNGNMILPGSLHASGRRYAFVGEPPTSLDQLPEQPAWLWSWVKQARARGATESGAVSTNGAAPVRLGPRGQQRWNGELVKKKKNGELDRSESLFFLGLDLAEANASRAAIVGALAERDISLGWNKFSDRDDAPDRYGEIADKALEYEEKQRCAVEIPTAGPTPITGHDGADGCLGCRCCARLPQIVAQVNHLLEREQARDRLRKTGWSGEDRAALEYISDQLDDARRKGLAETKLFYPEAKKECGVGAATFTRVVKRIEAHQLAGDLVPARVVRGRTRNNKPQVRLTIDRDGSFSGDLTAFAALRRDDPQHGGRGCRNHPDEKPVVRIVDQQLRRTVRQWVCPIDGQVVAEKRGPAEIVAETLIQRDPAVESFHDETVEEAAEQDAASEAYRWRPDEQGESFHDETVVDEEVDRSCVYLQRDFETVHPPDDGPPPFHDETVYPPPLIDDPIWPELDWGGKLRREQERAAQLARIAGGSE